MKNLYSLLFVWSMQLKWSVGRSSRPVFSANLARTSLLARFCEASLSAITPPSLCMISGVKTSSLWRYFSSTVLSTVSSFLIEWKTPSSFISPIPCNDNDSRDNVVSSFVKNRVVRLATNTPVCLAVMLSKLEMRSQKWLSLVKQQSSDVYRFIKKLSAEWISKSLFPSRILFFDS